MAPRVVTCSAGIDALSPSIDYITLAYLFILCISMHTYIYVYAIVYMSFVLAGGDELWLHKSGIVRCLLMWFYALYNRMHICIIKDQFNYLHMRYTVLLTHFFLTEKEIRI